MLTPQNMSIGCTTSCAKTCLVIVKATDIKKGIGNEHDR